MRDPKRIDEVLAAIREVWVREPDLRLGQLVLIATRPRDACPEVFAIEDDKLLDGLRTYARIKAGKPSA
jgi:hypothetical protein